MKTVVRLSVYFIMVVILTALGLDSSYAIDLKDPSVVGAWLFDEGSGNDVKDSSQYHNDGTVTNTEWVDGVFGKALEFGVNSGSVEIPHSDSLDFSGKDKISVSCWINIMGDDINWGRIVDKNPVNSSYTMTKVEGRDSVLWRVAAPGRIEIQSSTLKRNRWYHIVGVYDGTEVRFYLDGELDQTQSGKGTLGSADSALTIGGDAPVGGRSRFVGMIDDVVILDRVLTEAEIEEIKEKGAAFAAVEPAEKLTTTWGRIKTQN